MISLPGNFSNSFKTFYSNVASVRPNTTLWGTSITPGNNVMGTATSLGITCTTECYGILVCINGGASQNTVRNMLININMDPAGGTAYTTILLPYLIGSCAAPLGFGTGGIWYYFPIYIPAGATLAAQAQVNNATVGTVGVACWTFSNPTHPESLRYGYKCEAIGVVTASSQGTAVTPGTTSDGTWTSLGTSTQQNIWWQLGFSIANGTITSLVYAAELSADNSATKPRILINDVIVGTSTTEQITYNSATAAMICSDSIALGTSIYGRIQCSGTAVTGITMIAYGVA